ncbi:MAG: hypothetical protein KDB27_11505 [Planctomycetales bacterium]|nr:hypothetical protein [Planctomycetales bacterium]
MKLKRYRIQFGLCFLFAAATVAAFVSMRLHYEFLEVEWKTYSTEEAQTIVESRRPVIVFVSVDWNLTAAAVQRDFKDDWQVKRALEQAGAVMFYVETTGEDGMLPDELGSNDVRMTAIVGFSPSAFSAPQRVDGVFQATDFVRFVH